MGKGQLGSLVLEVFLCKLRQVLATCLPEESERFSRHVVGAVLL